MSGPARPGVEAAVHFPAARMSAQGQHCDQSFAQPHMFRPAFQTKLSEFMQNASAARGSPSLPGGCGNGDSGGSVSSTTTSTVNSTTGSSSSSPPTPPPVQPPAMVGWTTQTGALQHGVHSLPGQLPINSTNNHSNCNTIQPTAPSAANHGSHPAVFQPMHQLQPQQSPGQFFLPGFAPGQPGQGPLAPGSGNAFPVSPSTNASPLHQQQQQQQAGVSGPPNLPPSQPNLPQQQPQQQMMIPVQMQLPNGQGTQLVYMLAPVGANPMNFMQGAFPAQVPPPQPADPTTLGKRKADDQQPFQMPVMAPANSFAQPIMPNGGYMAMPSQPGPFFGAQTSMPYGYYQNPMVTMPKRRRKRRKAPSCSSKYRGVSWHKRDRRWVARAWVHGRTENLGTYVSEKLAAIAVDERLIKSYGPTAEMLLNFPDHDERRKIADEEEERVRNLPDEDDEEDPEDLDAKTPSSRTGSRSRASNKDAASFSDDDDDEDASSGDASDSAPNNSAHPSSPKEDSSDSSRASVSDCPTSTRHSTKPAADRRRGVNSPPATA